MLLPEQLAAVRSPIDGFPGHHWSEAHSLHVQQVFKIQISCHPINFLTFGLGGSFRVVFFVSLYMYIYVYIYIFVCISLYIIHIILLFILYISVHSFVTFDMAKATLPVDGSRPQWWSDSLHRGFGRSMGWKGYKSMLQSSRDYFPK